MRAPNRFFSAANRAGRLVEAWALQFNTIHDVAMFGMQSSEAIAAVDGQVIICSDYSNLQALPSTVFSAFVEVLKRANPRLMRAALVMPRKGTSLRHQMEALMQKATHPNRRLCADPAEAKAWLSSLLTREEELRLDQFLRERSSIDAALIAELRKGGPQVTPPQVTSQPPSSRRRKM